MPNLSFKVEGVKAAERGLTPLLHFPLEITNQPAEETIQSVILQAQIQVQSPQRGYNGTEKEKLVELFGLPEQWGQTLRNKLWTLTNTTVGTFAGRTTALLSVPCTFDLNVAATKYFYALEEGEVPLLFLFSGSVFYAGAEGRLQVEQISWNSECTYRMPVARWREVMEHHYPNAAWLSLERATFERLYQRRRREGLATWEALMERLLGEET